MLVFDNRYHDFLINDITATSLTGFASSPPTSHAPFSDDFGTWWQDKSTTPERNHLDSDIVLAFPAEGPHPDFHPFTLEFANNNAAFLSAFHEALDKMSKLGVSAMLQHPGDCDGCTSTGVRLMRQRRALMSDDEKRRLATVSIDDPGSLNATHIYSLIRRFTDVQTENRLFLANRLFSRRFEFINATTPKLGNAPTPGPV